MGSDRERLKTKFNPEFPWRVRCSRMPRTYHAAYPTEGAAMAGVKSWDACCEGEHWREGAPAPSAREAEKP